MKAVPCTKNTEGAYDVMAGGLTGGNPEGKLIIIWMSSAAMTARKSLGHQGISLSISVRGNLSFQEYCIHRHTKDGQQGMRGRIFSVHPVTSL